MKENPKFSFYDRNAPIYTQSRFLPPSKLVDCDIEGVMIGDGCNIQKSTIKNSLIGLRAIIHEGCNITVSERGVVAAAAFVFCEATATPPPDTCLRCAVPQDSLIMGADYFETYEECSVRAREARAAVPSSCDPSWVRAGQAGSDAPCPSSAVAPQALPGCTPIGIGAGTTIRKAIVDKNARIGMDCQIVNKDGVMEANREEQFYVIKARRASGCFFLLSWEWPRRILRRVLTLVLSVRTCSPHRTASSPS